MDYTIVENEDDMAKAAAARIAKVIREKQAIGKDAVIGLATGSTPIKVYAELVRMHNEEGLNFDNVITFNLDEYVVDKAAQPNFYTSTQSYHGFMQEHLFRHMKFKKNYIPDGGAEDLVAECKAYEKKIEEAGGIDIQLVGIGSNGHIGFNEPGSPIDGLTSVVDLAPSTMETNNRKFGFASNRAISMGLGTIMKARSILMIATGDSKAQILENTGRAVIIPVREYDEAQYHARINQDIQGNPSRVLHYHPRVEAIVSKDAGARMLITDQEILAPRNVKIGM